MLYGGSDIGGQMRDLNSGCHLIVAVMIERGKIGAFFLWLKIKSVS